MNSFSISSYKLTIFSSSLVSVFHLGSFQVGERKKYFYSLLRDHKVVEVLPYIYSCRKYRF